MPFCLLILALFSQPLATVSGRILNEEGLPLSRAVAWLSIDTSAQLLPGGESAGRNLPDQGQRHLIPAFAAG